MQERGHRRTPGLCVCEAGGGCSAALVGRGGGGGGGIGGEWLPMLSKSKTLTLESGQVNRNGCLKISGEDMAPHLSHSYTYRLPEEQQNTVEISLRFPRISSFRYHFSLPFYLCKNECKESTCPCLSDGV